MRFLLRNIWWVLVLIPSTLFHAATAVIPGWLGWKDRPGGPYDFSMKGYSRSLLFAAGVKVKTTGLEKIPDQPVVYISNHQSWFDIFMLSTRLPGHLKFVAKKELAKAPFFGPAMVASGHVLIDRQNRQAAFGAYEEAGEYIKRGTSAIVFAEGTRSRTGELQPFKKGPFVLAIAAQAPVVPVYCGGTFEVMQKGRPWVRSKTVELIVGDPISTEGMTYEDRGTLTETAFEAMKRLRDEYRSRK